MMDGWNMTGWGWTWMSMGTIVGIVVIALLVRASIESSGSRTSRTEEDPALEALRHRFASGEIDEEEFNRRRATLQRRV